MGVWIASETHVAQSLFIARENSDFGWGWGACTKVVIRRHII